MIDTSNVGSMAILMSSVRRMDLCSMGDGRECMESGTSSNLGNSKAGMEVVRETKMEDDSSKLEWGPWMHAPRRGTRRTNKESGFDRQNQAEKSGERMEASRFEILFDLEDHKINGTKITGEGSVQRSESVGVREIRIQSISVFRPVWLVSSYVLKRSVLLHQIYLF